MILKELKGRKVIIYETISPFESYTKEELLEKISKERKDNKRLYKKFLNLKLKGEIDE